MKKILLFFAALALLISCGGNNCEIDCTLNDSTLDGTTLYFRNYDNGDTIDSVTVNGNKFAFKGHIESPYLATMKIGDGRMFLVLEPGKLVIDFKNDTLYGTPLNDKYQAIANELNRFINNEDSIVAAFKTHYESNKDNVLGTYFFYYYLQMADLNANQIKAEIENAPENIKGSKRISDILTQIEKEAKTAEGSKFVDFAVKQPDGKEAKLSDYVGNDALLIVDFWASWCGPCRHEIETSLKKIYEKYNGKGVTMLSVAVWDKLEDTQRVAADLNIQWNQIVDAQQIPSDIYGFNGIPHIMIISPDGTILSRGLQGAELEQKVDELMSGK